MQVLQQKPVTPSGRFYLKNKVEVSKKHPEKALTRGHHRKKGRNTYGRITSRRRGGGHKRLYRTIDFRRSRHDEIAKVIAVEYDPNRTSHIALLDIEYENNIVDKYQISPTVINFFHKKIWSLHT